MFHYEEKLKDLKVEWDGYDYVISYKDEQAIIFFDNDRVDSFILRYKDDGANMKVEDAHHIVVGKGNLKRDVWHFSTPDGPLPTLRCGYTEHNDTNTWSSTPHPFEEKLESGFEEVFLYLLAEDGNAMSWWQYAIQCGEGMWQDGSNIDSMWRVENRDISAIPMGYHPVVGEPGVHVSYIWAYLAKHKEWEKLP